MEKSVVTVIVWSEVCPEVEGYESMKESTIANFALLVLSFEKF